MFLNKFRAARRRSVAVRVIRTAVAAAPLLGFGTFAWADASTWTFNGNGSWTVGSNWDNGAPNSSATDAFIDDGDSSVNVTLDASRQVHNFSLGSDDTLTFANGTSLQIFGPTIVNSGTIAVTAGANGTDLSIGAGGNTTLSGGGVIILSGANAGINGSNTLINQDNRIQGFGGLGQNNIGITNQGMIDANVNGQTLSLDPANGSGLTNTGTMQASNGGILSLTGNAGGGFSNSGGIIQAIGANSEVQLTNGASITGGTLTSSGGAVIRNTINQTGTLSGLTNAGTFIGDNESFTDLAGTITNNGTMILNAGTFDTRFVNEGAVTLGGNGIMILSGSSASINGNGTLTNSASHTIVGQGNIGDNSVAIINNGTINANVSGAGLLIDPSNGGNVTNNSIMLASGGGLLQLTGNGGGIFDNTNGTIQALTGSEVQLTTSASITGGTLATSGSGVIRNVSGQVASLSNLTNSGSFLADNNSDTHVSGTITNNGTINLDSSTANTRLILDSATTFNGSGQIILTGSNAQITGGSTLTNSASHAIVGQGNIGDNSVAIVNNGTINANVSGAGLLIDPSNGGNVTNNSIMLASGGGLLQLTGNGGGIFDNTSGTIQALTGSEVQLTTSASITGGTLTSSGGAVIRNTINQTGTLSGLTNAGTFIGDNESFTDLAGTITNNGTMILNAGTFDTRFVNEGAVTLGGNGIMILSGSSASINGNGTLTNSASHTIVGQGNIGDNSVAIVNNGTINANVSGAGLLIDPSNGGNVTNNSIMLASGGGLLQLTGNGGGIFDNTNGTIQALTGSEVQLTTSASITGGTLTSSGGAVIRNTINQTGTLSGLTNAGTFIGDNESFTDLAGTITNNGTMILNAGTFDTRFVNEGAVTLGGNGIMILSGSSASINGNGTLTNSASHTIVGQGNIGDNSVAIINNGTINANVSAQNLVLDPSNGGNMINTGTLRASGDGVLVLTGNAGGSFSNNGGTIEALDGSSVQATGATLSNDIGGTLTSGTYRSVSTGSLSSLNMNGPVISEIAGSTTVELNGVLSAITFGGTPLESSLTTNLGTLKVLGNRNYTTSNAFANGVIATDTAILQLGGGTFTSASLTNQADSTIFGFGTVAPRPLNHGTIQAVGGTLAFLNGINGGSGTIEAVDGATIDLSAGTSTSSADFLLLDSGTMGGGHLNLGSNNVLVAVDYNNANTGVGNNYNPRANVTGTGQIQASPGISQTLTGNITGGLSATATMNLGNLRVGSTTFGTYAVNNVGGSGPSLRGAIQTNNVAGNNGNITDSRLSGTGVTAQNFGPIAANSVGGTQTVTFNATSAGALTGQQVAIVNDFDNVPDQSLVFTGAAYNPAVAGVTPGTINFGNFHVGDTVTPQAIMIANTAPGGSFTEDLLANNFLASPDAQLDGSDPTSELVLGGSSNNNLLVGISTATAGNRSGKVTMDLQSNATVNNVSISGISPLSLGSATVNVSATVYRLATPSVPSTLNLGQFRVGDVAQGGIVVGNTGTTDGFTENLLAQLTGFSPDVTAGSGSTTIGAGSNSGGALMTQISTASAGNRSGVATISLTSVAGGVGLSNTPLGTGTTNVQAAVFNPATPLVNNSPINFPIVHVGDTSPSGSISITNNATAGSFSENLDVNFGTVGTNLTTNNGSISLLAPQATNNSAMKVGIDTSSAHAINSNIQLSFTTNGSGVDTLTPKGVGSQLFNVTGQVNNYAHPDFAKQSGSGSFTGSGTSYTLDFGTVQSGSAVSADLELLNDVPGLPADSLGGSFNTGGPQYTFVGFGSFTPIAPDGDLDNLQITLDTSSPGGPFTGSITFSPLSENANFSGTGPLSTITIDLTGNVVVPEPSCLVFSLVGGAMLLRR